MSTELDARAMPAADGEGEYRPLSPWAVAAAALGVASLAAWISPLLWIVPIVAVAVCARALADLRQASPPRSGRLLALAGLALACFMAAAAPARYVSHALLLRRQAQTVCAQWFAALAHGQPQYAHQWELPPRGRAEQPLDDESLRAFYEKQPEARDGLKQLVQNKFVRTLLALGPAAQARYYETADFGGDDANDWISVIYAVTYDRQGQRKSFFCRLFLQRDAETDGKSSPWHIVSRVGGVKPPTLGG